MPHQAGHAQPGRGGQDVGFINIPESAKDIPILGGLIKEFVDPSRNIGAAEFSLPGLLAGLGLAGGGAALGGATALPTVAGALPAPILAATGAAGVIGARGASAVGSRAIPSSTFGKVLATLGLTAGGLTVAGQFQGDKCSEKEIN